MLPGSGVRLIRILLRFPETDKVWHCESQHPNVPLLIRCICRVCCCCCCTEQGVGGSLHNVFHTHLQPV